ncbi:MAG TPA: hybrid-cluster NAD(P)-dependent oxidoreductase [Segeticoccus sp.]|nr:hybrid-cluster NAD(P)-dependent oxidoreductase [Segeticoccus sp.]
MTDTLLPSAAPVAAGTALPAADPGPIEEDLLCTAVLDVTHDVKTIVLQRDSTPLAFLPGQYLTVTVDVDGERLSRCYSIDAPPTRPDRLSITVKRVEGGPVSTHLHRRLGVGDRLRVSGPYGRFTFGDQPSGAYLFLTAGSGITPAMSMVRTLVDRPGTADVVLVHNARTPEDIIFRSELAGIAQLPGFAVVPICEQGSASESWTGQTGRLTLRALLRAAPDLHEREVFTCGPPAYMEAVRSLLELAAVDPGRCHEENFDLAARGADAAADRPPAPGARRYAVQFRRSQRVVDCAADEPILAAAHRAGVRLPSMCALGMCGTCLTGLVEGHVDMQHGGGISRREVDEGKILVCCSRPVSDVVLDA